MGYATCPATGRKVFKAKADAKELAKQMSRRGSNYSGKFQAYRCRRCKAYHVRQK